VKPVLLDTGVIVALLDRSERFHERCVDIVSDTTAPLVTCEGVIAEACYLVRGFPKAVQAILENVRARVFEIPFAIGRSAKRVQELLKRYGNVPMDYADACLVCAAEELDTSKILTLDRDFAVYRWKNSRRFELLIGL
jgi:predicted nucleic acid-binding protein